MEKYGPKIVYIKSKLNTIADTVLQLEDDPSVNEQLKASTRQKSGIKKAIRDNAG